MKLQKGFSAVEGLAIIAVIAVIGIGGFLAVSSSDSDDEASKSETTTTQQESADFPLNVSFSNLAPLAQGAYEGWVVRDDVKYSFGTFNTTESGAVEGKWAFEDAEFTPQNGDTVAISIEPENDSDPEPSATIVLAGEIQNGSADLAFPLDVSSFAGQYILATPTTTTTDDETAGVWFTTTGMDTSLDIPVAPDGWAYEGWAVVDGAPISTGLFTDPSEADFFDGFSGPGNAPNKPGEDFVANAPEGREFPLDLRGGTIVVSIEPFQDGVDPTGPMPAQVKPLTHVVAEDAADHSPFDLVVSTDSVPSGSAQL